MERVREDVKEDMLISVRILMLSEMSRELRSLFYFCDDVVGPWRKHICVIELSGCHCDLAQQRGASYASPW